MKYKSVNAIATLFCGTILLFASSMTAFAQSGVRTAEFELNPPAETFDAVTGGGIFHFSFATGKTEWVPFRRPANIQELAELAMRERNPEKAPAGLDFSIRGELDMRKTPIMILSEDEIKSILSTGKLPEKKPTTKSQGMKPDSYYLLKDETDQSTYVFKLRDHSPGYVWQQLAYVRIPDGTSWKKNPDLTALLDVPKPDAASNTRRKTNADKTRQKIQLAWDKQEAERKIAAEQARQDALDKRIEDVKRQSGDTFPKTEEETMEVKGRSLLTGLPMTVSLSSSEMIEAFDEVSGRIIEAIHHVLEETPPELVADIAENGIVLTGGGSLLWGFDRLIESSTSIKTRLADDAQLCVAHGIVKNLSSLSEMQDGPLNLARRREMRK